VAPQSDDRGQRLKAQQEALSVKYADDPERLAEESDKLEGSISAAAPAVSKLIDHIDHIVKIAGIDHVGLGPDFDGANDFPEGARDVSMYPNITYELLKRGYSEQDIRKVLGENLLRVFAQAELVARKMSRSISGGGVRRELVADKTDQEEPATKKRKRHKHELANGFVLFAPFCGYFLSHSPGKSAAQ